MYNILGKKIPDARPQSDMWPVTILDPPGQGYAKYSSKVNRRDILPRSCE